MLKQNKIRCGAQAVMILLAVAMITAGRSPALAGTPEYMQMKFAVGKAYEIEIVPTKTAAWICTDIEELPKPRDPKFRGAIDSINYGDSSAIMFGVKLRFRAQTEYLESGTEKSSFDQLKKGQRVEVSLKLSESGELLVRKVSVTNIKKSNKIKGNLTRVVVSGKPPDTLEVYGVKILLVPETDIIKPQGYRETVAEEVFGSLALPEPDVTITGTRLGPTAMISGDYRMTLRARDELDLSRRIATDRTETEPYLRLSLYAYPHRQLRAFSQGRVYKRYIVESDANETGSATTVELTQAYLLAPNLGGLGLAIQVGRQDFESSREWLFDDYLDAIRLYFFGVAPLRFEVALIHAVEPLNPKFRTWTDFLGMTTLRIDKHSALSAYVFARRDTDVRNREPIWWGAMYAGRISSQFRPWANFSLMRGSDKERPVRAYAFDIGATCLANDIEWTPSVTAGYAFASGDKTNVDDFDHGYRQTGYEDNVSRYGGLSKVPLYGLVLSPELSNLKVVTLGAGCRPFNAGSLEVIYHDYTQHYAEPDLQGTGLIDPPARPSGQSRDIGSAIDFVASSPEVLQRIRAVWSIGVFNPGEAYAPRQKRAVVNRLEFNVKF